jgi:2-keto-4-pentenoate hydratase/2-oxohepta-3-ene-1,7-dioic acid hydratase in catechol pathway
MKLARWSWRDRGPQTTFGVVRDDRTVIDLGKRFEGRLAGVTDILTPEALDAVSRAVESGANDGKLSDVHLQPPVARPGKILCVGVNYPERNAEYKDGTDAPKYPSLFVRFPGSFVGHESSVLRPPESTQFDYEGEIVLVVGKSGRRIPEARAADHIFGLTLMNEGSVRDWLRHGKFNVTQGKNFDKSGSIGPWIVPKASAPAFDNLTILTRVNGEERQRGNTGTLMFPFARIIAYISTFTTLEPGDLIATGTPPGAGARFDPPRWLVPGDIVEIECPGVGVLRNTVADEPHDR